MPNLQKDSEFDIPTPAITNNINIQKVVNRMVKSEKKSIIQIDVSLFLPSFSVDKEAILKC